MSVTYKIKLEIVLLFKEFLLKFWEEFWEEKEFWPKFRLHRILAEISDRKGISAKPKPKSKIKFSVSV